MKILQLIFSFLPVLVLNRCIHEQIIKNKTLIPIEDSQLHFQRLLTGLGSGPIRFYYQYNTTDISDDDAIGKNVKKIMEIIATFWSKTIAVNYLPYLTFNVPSNFDRNNIKCLDFHVPRRLIDNPTPEKDFGFFIEAKDDGDSGVTAYSYPCAFSKTDGRSMWGIVHWNKEYMTFDPLSFQENIHIGIHQMLHVLGFSEILYPKFKNKNAYVTTSAGSFITGPYMRKQLIRQYGCQNPPGMLLESGGGQGTALSHWSRKTASNELMTAGVSVNNPTISYITLALLQQTGWYKTIYKNNGRYINFGFRKGCGMLQAKNCSSNEYCTVKNEKKPDYDGTALGYCKNDSLSQCLYIKYYINFICTDPNYVSKSLHADQGVINRTGETGGQKSRCYSSNLRISGTNNTKYDFRCYETMCSPTGLTLTIRIGNNFAFCLFPNQNVKVKGFDGSLKCPTSFKSICKIKRCPDECSGNGICLDGKCLCGQNFSGQSCSKLSSKGFSSRADLFLPSSNNNCLIGSYLNAFGYCSECKIKGCSRCNANECFVCFDESLPQGDKCL